MERESLSFMCVRVVMVMLGGYGINSTADKKPNNVLLGTYFIIFIYLTKKPLYAGCVEAWKCLLKIYIEIRKMFLVHQK